MAPAPFSVQLLRDTAHGGPPQQIHQVAQALATFITPAQRSIDLAIYDFRLDDPAATQTVVGALTAAATRGVQVRIGYDAGKPATAMLEELAHNGASGESLATAAALAFAAVGGDPAPPGTAAWIAEHFGHTEVQTRAIHAAPQLMHSKFIVRDAPTAPRSSANTTSTVAKTAAAVWTGSTNFTDDAWTRQENNIITISDDAIAAGYRVDFDQMWQASAISHAGRGDAGTTTVNGAHLGWDFCPGDGTAINRALADRITKARTRVLVGSMVLTSHQVLAALAGAIHRGLQVVGIYDAGQMDPIVDHWKANPETAAVVKTWETVAAVLVGKKSMPYSPNGVHDFMHLKVLVADGTVVTGSYNFSANATRNAENQLHTDDPTTVQAYVDYLDVIIRTYRTGKSLTEPADLTRAR